MINDIGSKLLPQLSQRRLTDWKKSAVIFFKNELVELKLSERVLPVEEELLTLYGDEGINFLSTNSRFLCFGFSDDDKSKWMEIERLLTAFCGDTEGVILKDVQNRIIFKFIHEKLPEPTMSREEELVLRSILMECYLTSLRELKSFFHNTNNSLVKLKEDRITQLASQKLDNGDHDEIDLLNREINELKKREKKVQLKRNELNRRIDLWRMTAVHNNTDLNSTSDMQYFTEIVNSFKSSYMKERQVTIDFSKKIKDYAKYEHDLNNPLLDECLQLFHYVTFAVIKIASNHDECKSWNNEKKMSVVSLANSLRSILVDFELEITEHYTEEILIHLQAETLGKQFVSETKNEIRKDNFYSGMVFLLGVILTNISVFLASFIWKKNKIKTSNFFMSKQTRDKL